jgi:hypothetical protein
MNEKEFSHPGSRYVLWPLMFAAAFFASVAAIPIRAAEVWDGPLFTYSQPSADPTQATNQDHITPDVWLTRAASGGLFNAFYETNATALSPANTAWAFGTLTNYDLLTYTNWLAWLHGNSPTTMVGSNIVVHLISEDIYLSFKFSFWASKGAGGFTYQRSTPILPVIFAPRTNANNGWFNFTYTAHPGTAYLVLSSSNLTDWLPLATNMAVNTLVPFTDPMGSTGIKCFRVSELPTP